MSKMHNSSHLCYRDVEMQKNVLFFWFLFSCHRLVIIFYCAAHVENIYRLSFTSVNIVFYIVVFNFAGVNIVLKSNQSFVGGIKEWGRQIVMEKIPQNYIMLTFDVTTALAENLRDHEGY